MPLPSLSRLPLREEAPTGTWGRLSDGRQNHGEDILPLIEQQRLQGVTTMEELCRLLEYDEMRTLDWDMKLGVRNAVRDTRYMEAFAEQFLRRELQLAPGENLPLGQFTSWLGMLRTACRVYHSGVEIQGGVNVMAPGSPLWRSYSIVRMLVYLYGHDLEHAAPRLQNDERIVRRAISRYAMALQHAGPDMKANRDVVLAAVTRNGMALQYASEGIRNTDADVVRAAVAQNGAALAYAGPDMQNDVEVVLAAVRQNGAMLRLAGPVPRANKRVVLAAVRKAERRAFHHASPELQRDPEVRAAAGLHPSRSYAL